MEPSSQKDRPPEAKRGTAAEGGQGSAAVGGHSKRRRQLQAVVNGAQQRRELSLESARPNGTPLPRLSVSTGKISALCNSFTHPFTY